VAEHDVEGPAGPDDAVWEEVRAVASRVLRAKGYDHADADDAAQDTLVDLMRALERGERIDNPPGWAAVIAGRRAIDQDRVQRRQKGKPARRDRDPDADDDADGESATPSAEAEGTDRDGDSATDHAEEDGEDCGPRGAVVSSSAVGRFVVDGLPTSRAAIERQQLARLAEVLTERQLQIAWLTVEGLTQAEIGEVVGLGAEGVRKDMQRMRVTLRKHAVTLGISIRVLDHPRPY
jgi:RNA polymerase sigma factor (sigma-70 family)